MSKHLGNILEPIPLMDEHGADAVRWFMAARRLAVGGAPGRARARSQEIVRKVLLTYWNTVAFHALYARAAGLDARRPAPAAGRAARAGPLGARREAHRLVREVDRRRWRRFDTQRAGHAARGVRRRPVQLVRPPLPPPVLGRRPGRAARPCTSACDA